MSDGSSATNLEADALFDSSAPIEPGGAQPQFPAEVPAAAAAPATTTCPACGFEQPPTEECVKCGLVVSKFRARPAAESGAEPDYPEVRSPEEIAADLADQGYTPRERVTSVEEDDGFFAPERRGLDRGILGGVVMMGIAVVWFGLGWAAGYIFFYPPVLFVIGLFGTLKGLFTGNVAG